MFKKVLCSLFVSFSLISLPVLAQAPATPPTATAPQTAMVNINTASEETLISELVGVGAVKAKAIVEHRTKFGAFKNLEELLEVPGIGPATIEQNKQKISFK